MNTIQIMLEAAKTARSEMRDWNLEHPAIKQLDAAIAAGEAELKREPKHIKAFKGWVLDRVEDRENGIAGIGCSYEDGGFAQIIEIDTGNYYQNAAAVPLANAIVAAIKLYTKDTL